MSDTPELPTLSVNFRLEAVEALEDLDSYLCEIGGCTDGNCIVVKPKGMHTNGGCHCSTDKYKMTRLAYAYTTFASAIRKAIAKGE